MLRVRALALALALAAKRPGRSGGRRGRVGGGAEAEGVGVVVVVVVIAILAAAAAAAIWVVRVVVASPAERGLAESGGGVGVVNGVNAKARVVPRGGGGGGGAAAVVAGVREGLRGGVADGGVEAVQLDWLNKSRLTDTERGYYSEE